jgi:hypothetical protein
MRTLTSIAALATLASSVFAQTTTTRAPVGGPPVRRISTASALSTTELGGITSVVELRDGRVLVNDGTRRRLLLMDTTLKHVDVILDSLSEVANTYGTRAGALIPYRGDSVLFVDPAALVTLVLDPEARVTRVRSVWRPEEVQYYSNAVANVGVAATDAKGRVVYRVPARAQLPKVAPPGGVPYFPSPPDSAFVVAIDIDTRTLDTVGTVRIPKVIYQVHQSAEGYFSISVLLNPMPTTDDWGVLSNGTVAFLRGRDYRIDYRQPDGTWTSSPKLPFDWQHSSEADKQAYVDSVKSLNRRQQMSTYVTSMIRWANMYEKPYPKDFKVPDGFIPQFGLAREWKLPPGLTLPPSYVYACAANEEPKMIQQTGGPPAGTPSCIPSPIMLPGGVAPPPPTIREVAIIPADELPDYRPPFVAGAARADADGNLWVRTIPTKPVPGGSIYDIVNAQGELVDRVQLPPGYTLVGFGKGKVVYLSTRDASGIHLARVRLR